MTPIELERFEAKYSPCPNTGCWLWFGATIGAGYGYIHVDSKSRRAHRVSFEHFKRPLATDEMVCHRCDVRWCVNPDHLFAGSAKDNIQDCLRKGRRDRVQPPHRRGEKANRAKLTSEQVLEIRATHKRAKLYRGVSPTSMSGLALRFGVAGSTINSIIQRKTWSHI